MQAPGAPGLEPRWTSSDKMAVGTSIAGTSRVWFTLSHGILNEIYFPRMDQANTRDAQFLVLTRDGRFLEEKRDLRHDFHYIDPDAPAFELINTDPQGTFRIIKRIVTWPDGNVVIQQFRFEVLHGSIEDFRVFLLVAPHIGNQGAHNNAQIITLREEPALLAWREATALCIQSTAKFKSCSVGYVGASDGWTQLYYRRTLEAYDEALDGNVALTAELDLTEPEQMIALAFGRSIQEAKFTASLALLHPYYTIEQRYIQQWREYMSGLSGLLPYDDPHSREQRISAMVLKIHHGKLFPGGIIASLSIPWGNAAGDGNMGGYHLVWPRDMVEAAQAFIALGDIEAAWQALLFLIATQKADGSWPQNFWLDGVPYWSGSQLDETAFPIHLAYHLWQLKDIKNQRAVYGMVKKALRYICLSGPVTQQDRWEEDGGYSPSTLAATISALVLGADLARQQGDDNIAEFCEHLADYWQGRIDKWTFTEHGQVDPRFPRHYVRIHVSVPPSPDGRVEHGYVPIKNVLPGEPNQYPEEAVIDGGFLELVRYGLKSPRDPHIVDSVAAYDAVLKVDLPYGPLWHRYNHDGYGEMPDGSPFQGAGQGRLWPLLAGERGHYALALGESPEPYLKAMEGASSVGGMIPEQVWDQPDIPEKELYFGRPSGSAMPLVWAHAEYIKLLRSAMDGRVFELPDVVRMRYTVHPTHSAMVFWQFNHKRHHFYASDETLRIVVPQFAQCVFTTNEWKTHEMQDMRDNGLGVYFLDVDLKGQDMVEFTFYWPEAGHWEGQNYRLDLIKTS
ncbi:glucoamylase [Sulfobacillus thermosulfidooxidans DSM 9293]|uniref:Glucoamylase n=1 Tax=Sulfobacillus thermosulfidooxidans (strain DSM 9293 / VKM B-1269 / AT-1) TaxID=929705 RepID=A0A1W1W806_SULTA|nr:glycoside hydrolase family 15 protein [Sulfobacillus thermosulfidooxidans]SMC02190.1 glucoamylase [Sulfobacillus thermosulfidooxidans DSM 9293]